MSPNSNDNLVSTQPRSGVKEPGNAPTPSLLFSLIRHIEDADILDLGCGNGNQVAFLIHLRAGKVTGVDASSNLIAEARNTVNHHDATFICSEITAYRAPKESFDIVISSDALNTISDLKVVFRNVYQSLRPDGQFVFSVQHPFYTNKHQHTISTIINSLTECGFVVQRVEESMKMTETQPDLLIVKAQKHETAI